MCFNHPNWVDPFLLATFWPEPPWLYIFGPKEEDMGTGWKNRLISWSRMAVPFKPSNRTCWIRRAVRCRPEAWRRAGHRRGGQAE